MCANTGGPLTNQQQECFMATADITAALLRELFHYDPDTGVFTRLVRTSNNCTLGPSGMLTKRGSVAVSVCGKKRAAHRLAWLYMTGEWPADEIDHIDGDQTNNRFANLRECSGAENKQNMRRARRGNKSGFLGVSRHQGQWQARIHMGGKVKRLGLFKTPEEAHLAYVAAKRQLHPFGVL
mgnify:CR=1 FL=1